MLLSPVYSYFGVTPPFVRTRCSGGPTGEDVGVGGRHGDQVQSDLPQRRLRGQRVQHAQGLEEGLRVLHLLLRPGEADLRTAGHSSIIIGFI